MKIVFFGDSYTQGTPYPTDSKNIWPNIVAEHFDADVENKYVAGGSNHAIMRNICRYFQQSSCDVAIVMWSDWSRTEVHVNEQVYQLQPNGNSFDEKFINDYYKNRNLDIDWEDFLDKIWLCDKLNNNRIRIVQGCCFELANDFEKPANWFPYNMHELALKKTPCGHPHISQHKDIARAMIQHIEGCNIL
jgi:hypothetical protein